MSVASLTRENAELRATVKRFRLQREELRARIDDLEAEVSRLESEGLQPLVDRLLELVRVMKDAIEAMEAEASDA
jgi:predicted nuclease with TOPRIM domain